MSIPKQAANLERKPLSPPKPGVAVNGTTVAPILPNRNDAPAHIKCTVDVLDDGSADAIVQIDAEILRRLQNRAGTMDLGQYLWNNVFRRALEGHVY